MVNKTLTNFDYISTKVAHEAKSEDIRDEKTLLDLRRQYHCAAYNLMVAFTSLSSDQIFNFDFISPKVGQWSQEWGCTRWENTSRPP